MKIDNTDKGKWVALLMGVKFFSNCTEEELAALLDVGEVRHYKLHDYIIKEDDGTEDHSFFVILKGSAKVLKKAPMAMKKEVAALPEGECFGEMAFLLNTARTAYILAMEDCYMFCINAEDVGKMNDAIKAKIYHQFAISMANKLKYLTESLLRPYY
ncbi:MAG: cyclic nucleotide-binding domain-containing protein [Nitrospinae bacterium]|nr:cyclic nucleotide-binding domain-containing protein [Nitrospinota bacterium]